MCDLFISVPASVTLPEVESAHVTPSTSGRKRTRGAAVEAEIEARLKKVRCLTEEEAFICQVRRELAMMDTKIKEDEMAITAARREIAEAVAARIKVTTAQLEHRKMEEALQLQRELGELQKEEIRRRMVR